MLKRIDIVKIVSLIMWGAAIFSYFFQFPFKSISNLIIPCLGVFLVCRLKDLRFDKKSLFMLICLLIWLTFSMAMALANDTGITRIIRFLFILIAIVFCSFIQTDDFKTEIDIFVWLAIGKSLLLIAIALTMVMIGDHSFIRYWAQTNELGDIYMWVRWAPKVQVQGNALLLIAFFMEYYKKKRISINLGILLLGVLCAGNFAYILGLGLFIIFLISKEVIPLVRNNSYVVKIVIGLLVMAYVVVMPYLMTKIEEKAEVSNQTRVDQIEILLDANLVIGEGLGNHIVASTSTRDYDGAIYYELQTLYILNQIGIVGLLFFYTTLFLNLNKRGYEKVVLYLIYLVYTFWNPYCFDTTQMIATLLIMNMTKSGEADEESNRYSLLSRFRKCR